MKDNFDYEPDFLAYEMAQQAQEQGGGKPLASPQAEQKNDTGDKQSNTEQLLSVDLSSIGYFYNKNCIYRKKTEEDKNSLPDEIFVCSEIVFLGLARDKNNLNWSYACEILDPDFQKHKVFIKCSLIYGTNKELIELLASYGINFIEKEIIPLFKKVKQLLKKRVRIVEKNGWYNGSYIFANGKVISLAVNEEFIFNSNMPSNLYTQAGRLEKWQEVKTLIQGNTRLEFSYLVAFAGVLLEVAGLEGGFFSLEGQSSTGKTTGLQVACAVWGNVKSHLKQFRSTTNALESVTTYYNHNTLVLDELGQVSSKELDEMVYMIPNGKGKGRANKNGDSKQEKEWLLLCLCSGEVGFSQRLAEDGRKAKAGQEVRFIGISTSKDHICELHGLESAKDLIDRIKQLTAENYGFDGKVFVKYVVENYSLIKNAINGKLSGITKNFYTGNNSQIERVAKKFALLEYTRLLLISAGLVPASFAKGTVKACFDDWITGRDGSDSHEEQEIINNLRLFIEENGASRFQDIKGSGISIINRAGFKEEQGDGENRKTVYLFLPEVFKKTICSRHKPSFVCEVLEKNHYLLIENKKSYGWQVKRYVKDLSKSTRLYAITFPDDEN